MSPSYMSLITSKALKKYIFNKIENKVIKKKFQTCLYLFRLLKTLIKTGFCVAIVMIIYPT